MGNAMSCFERWGKRQPDGPLLLQKSVGNNRLSTTSTASTLGSSPTARNASSSNTPQGGGTSSSQGSATAAASRPVRRRPTYSSKKMGSEGESETQLEISESEESEEGTEEELSAKDIRTKKIIEYRRQLTKVVKLKTAIFQMTVKVTIAKDGSDVLWYSGSSRDDGDGESKKKKKPAGQFPINKITSIKAKADNPKTVEVSIHNPTFETYSFSFKSREEREFWQQQMESLRKFLSMA